MSTQLSNSASHFAGKNMADEIDVRFFAVISAFQNGPLQAFQASKNFNSYRNFLELVRHSPDVALEIPDDLTCQFDSDAVPEEWVRRKYCRILRVTKNRVDGNFTLDFMADGNDYSIQILWRDSVKIENLIPDTYCTDPILMLEIGKCILEIESRAWEQFLEELQASHDVLKGRLNNPNSELVELRKVTLKRYQISWDTSDAISDDGTSIYDIQIFQTDKTSASSLCVAP